jgi:hypothetical protein
MAQAAVQLSDGSPSRADAMVSRFLGVPMDYFLNGQVTISERRAMP